MDLAIEHKKARKRYEKENPVEVIIRDKYGRMQKGMRMKPLVIADGHQPTVMGIGGSEHGLNR